MTNTFLGESKRTRRVQNRYRTVSPAMLVVYGVSSDAHEVQLGLVYPLLGFSLGSCPVSLLD